MCSKRHRYGPELLAPPVKTSQSISDADDATSLGAMQKFNAPPRSHSRGMHRPAVIIRAVRNGTEIKSDAGKSARPKML